MSIEYSLSNSEDSYPSCLCSILTMKPKNKSEFINMPKINQSINMPKINQSINLPTCHKTKQKNHSINMWTCKYHHKTPFKLIIKELVTYGRTNQQEEKDKLNRKAKKRFGKKDAWSKLRI